MSTCRRYVEQFDTLLGTLTVEEMLMYTAELKCPMSEPIAEKRMRVQKLLTDLGLEVCPIPWTQQIYPIPFAQCTTRGGRRSGQEGCCISRA